MSSFEILVVFALVGMLIGYQVTRPLPPAPPIPSQPAEPQAQTPPPAPPAPAAAPAVAFNSLTVHEAGHTLAVWYCPFVSRIVEVTLHESESTVWRIQRGNVRYGMAQHAVDDHRETFLWAEAVIALAGIAAEMSVYGKARSGHCIDDLAVAREMAAELVARGGSLEPPWKASPSRGLPFERLFATPLPPEEAKVLRHAYDKARAIVQGREALRDQVARLLFAKKRLTEEDLRPVLGSRRLLLALREIPIRRVVFVG